MKKAMMKNLLLKFLAAGIFLCACNLPQQQASKNLSTREIAANDAGLSFLSDVLRYDSQPFSGVLVENFPNGQVKSKTEYRQGKKHGAEWMWYEDGKLYWERSYENGEKHGAHRGWWPNGRQKFLYRFENGTYEGEVLEWYDNGQLFRRLHYVKGEEAGEQKAWRENGKLYVNYVMKNGKRYGLFNSRLCYKIKDGLAQY
jgi:antitoxin component YwqK of YwqJK toxin-antitoxin module